MKETELYLHTYNLNYDRLPIQLVVNQNPFQPHTFTLNSSGIYEPSTITVNGSLTFNPVYVDASSNVLVFTGDNFVNSGFLWNPTPCNATITFESGSIGNWTYRDVSWDFIGMTGVITVQEQPRNTTGKLI
jgi:hypothetical protein